MHKEYKTQNLILKTIDKTYTEQVLAYKYLKINGRWEDHIHMVLLNNSIN